MPAARDLAVRRDNSGKSSFPCLRNHIRTLVHDDNDIRQFLLTLRVELTDVATSCPRHLFEPLLHLSNSPMQRKDKSTGIVDNWHSQMRQSTIHRELHAR